MKLKIKRIEPSCPICGYTIKTCQCLFSGTCHPDRDKERTVVTDHLYLLTDEQIQHLKYLQAHWQISYADEEMNKFLKELKKQSIFEVE